MPQSRWFKSGWTQGRRARQSEAIHGWKPWLKSTGPRTDNGKAQDLLNLYAAQLTRMSVESLFRHLAEDSQ